jgi:DNA-binding NtrC family response regulator
MSPDNSCSRARRRVLVVDDDPLLRRYLAAEFQPGYDVLTAENYASAIDLLCVDGEAGVSAVVTDFMFGPGPDGIDLLTEVQRRWPSCVRLLVTGSSPCGRLENALETEVAHHVVSKPWRHGEVLAAVERLTSTGAT